MADSTTEDDKEQLTVGESPKSGILEERLPGTNSATENGNEDVERLIDYSKSQISEVAPRPPGVTPECGQYYAEHVKPLVDYYDRQQKRKKREFFGWQMVILVMGAGVTIINVYPTLPGDAAWVRLVWASVTVITGLTQLLRAQELWAVFGMGYMHLDSEWLLYLQHSGVYTSIKDDSQRCEKFIENFQNLRQLFGEKTWVIAGTKAP